MMLIRLHHNAVNLRKQGVGRELLVLMLQALSIAAAVRCAVRFR